MKKNNNIRANANFLNKKDINQSKKSPILTTLQSGVGNVKMLPSFAKEWKNIVYSFNKNNLKNLPVDTLFINKIIKNYFDIFLLKHRAGASGKMTIYKRNIKFLNKIYISNVDIKHTNQKAKITLYTVNKEKEYLKNSYFIAMKSINKVLLKRYTKLYKTFLLKIKTILFSYTTNITNKSTKKGYFSTISINKSGASKSNYIKYKLGYLQVFIQLNKLFLEKMWNNLVQKHYSDYLTILEKFDLLYSLHLLKFNKRKLLPKLSKILLNVMQRSTGRSKKIEYNIINLKSLTFNSDIFTNLSTTMVKKNPLLHPLNFISRLMRRIKFPRTNTIQERTRIESVFNKDPFRNKYKDLRIISNLHQNNIDSRNLNIGSRACANKNNNLKFKSSILREIVSTNSEVNSTYLKRMNISRFLGNLFKNSTITDNYSLSTTAVNTGLLQNDKYSIKNTIYKAINYKNMAGMRVEVKGRLSKRFRADRAAYYVKWTGGLKNIYSSFKGLSTALLRGNYQPHISQTTVKSTRRIGAFAVKGWIAGK